MITRIAPASRMISRRTTLQAALAAVIAGKALGRAEFAVAQTDSLAPWNWDGNAGHTGELPGPGLDLEQPLGELWRLPREEFFSDSYDLSENVIGSWNGVLYTLNGGSLWARRFQDGAFLWAQSPTELQSMLEATPSTEASPEAEAETASFSEWLTLDNGLLLATMDNGQLWGLDAATGEFRWKLSFETVQDYSIVTVADHIAYVDQLVGGASAYELTDPPTLRWSWNPDTEGGSEVLGVFNEHVYVTRYDQGVPVSLHALATSDGSELWRLTENDLGGSIAVLYGVTTAGIALLRVSPDSAEWAFMMVNHDGEVAWNRPGYGGNDTWWMTENTIIRASIGYELTVETLHPENGELNWQFETPFEVGSDLDRITSRYGLLCDGKAYGWVPDNDWTGPLLVIVDPVATKVVVSQGLSLRPVFIADGVMIAYDEDTDEIVAIGSVSGSLQAGGRATVTRDATLRGAPNDAAIERAQVTTGALVEITGDGETSSGTEWVSVTLSDTGKSGYLPADALTGQDGSIRFEAIDLSQLSQFGQLTTYPKFTTGTRAEITEETELRGAPGESSAGKGTLAAGTVVTVASRPTIGESVDVEWCSISVDATGDTGWVPTSVLKLIAPA